MSASFFLAFCLSFSLRNGRLPYTLLQTYVRFVLSSVSLGSWLCKREAQKVFHAGNGSQCGDFLRDFPPPRHRLTPLYSENFFTHDTPVFYAAECSDLPLIVESHFWTLLYTFTHISSGTKATTSNVHFSLIQVQVQMKRFGLKERKT